MLKIRDNGQRCLVEPCDKWDIVDVDGNVVARVSRIEMEGRQLQDAEVLMDTSLEGVIQEYLVDSLPNKGLASKKFVVR
ncbi:MAG: hypothetical protein QM576_17915 [Rhodopseudomonas sp.]|uniref:hypothetical protein n=1 Tax=Rhodopseudomonas sp. TaxID=1078 RepID=UPI0039E4F28D